MQQCQELIDKVREFRHLKVRERQIIKFNRLLQKQEGSMTYYKEGNRTYAGILLILSRGAAQTLTVIIPPGRP